MGPLEGGRGREPLAMTCDSVRSESLWVLCCWGVHEACMRPAWVPLMPTPGTRVTPAVQIWNSMLELTPVSECVNRNAATGCPCLLPDNRETMTYRCNKPQAVSHLFPVRNNSSCIWLYCVCVPEPLVTKPSPSLCSIVRRCHGLAWPSWLHCPPVSPTKELAWTLPIATSAPQRYCHTTGLIPYPRNYWATWRKGEAQTLPAPSCSGSQGQVSLIMLQGRRPRYDQECRLFIQVNGLKLKACPTVVCFSRIKKNIHHVHFLGFT